jgi:sulfur carrier protein ThiS
MKVKVLKLGYAAKEIDAPEGSTVEDSLRISELEQEGYSITLNGVGANLTAHLSEGDIVALTPKVEGGR